MGRTPLASRARAELDGRLLATTVAAVREDVPDGEPTLWFPRADAAPEVADGSGPWRTGEGELEGHVSFDHDQVRIELSHPDDGERPADVVRFPCWGDAADLVDVLDVRRDGDGRWVGATRSDWRRPVVEGSQMLGQAVVAASRHASGRRAVSASMVFPRAADARVPYHLVLDEVTSGRTFTTVRAEARQGERTCAVGTVLLDATAPDVIRHAASAPDVAGPDESVPYDMSVTGRDLRIVGDAYTGDPDAPTGPPELSAWVRFRRVPDDQAIHAGLLAQFTGHLSIAAALRPHAGIGQDQAHHSLSTAINAISLSIHGDVRADRWMLYHHHSTFAGDGMTHAECRVHDQDGALVASFTVDAMVRAFADATAADPRSAL
jgi:acyl-CoA thioesterase II